MEEDIKIIKNLISYLQEKISNGEDKIFYNELMWDEKTIDCINALEDIVQAYKEDEAVIDLMAKEINGKTLTKEQWCKLLNRTSNCEYDDTCLKCLKEHFRKKVQDERNKV